MHRTLAEMHRNFGISYRHDAVSRHRLQQVDIIKAAKGRLADRGFDDTLTEASYRDVAEAGFQRAIQPQILRAKHASANGAVSAQLCARLERRSQRRAPSKVKNKLDL